MFTNTRLFSLKYLPFVLCGCFLFITGLSASFFREAPLVSARTSVTPQTAIIERNLKIDESALPDNLINIIEARNLQSSEFPVGFEIKLKNISGKPIYYIALVVVLPEMRKYLPSNDLLGFPLIYGESRLSMYNSIAQPGDKFIAPGESVILSIDEEQARHFFDRFGDNKKEVQENGTKKVGVIFQRASFGDGTGYQLKDRLPATRLKSQNDLDSAINACPYEHCYHWLLQEQVQCGDSEHCKINAPSSNFGGTTCKELCFFSITCYFEGQPYSCSYSYLVGCTAYQCDPIP